MLRVEPHDRGARRVEPQFVDDGRRAKDRRPRRLHDGARDIEEVAVAATLAEAGSRHGFGVEIVAKVEDGSGVVSSSAIRKALEQGDLGAAARGLGRNYSVSGQVISGQRLGRTLGVPTANIVLEPTNRLAHGIYAVVARVDGCAFPAVASFGTRPTVDDGPPLLEVHLLDFDGDLYGREMEVEFVERIREERKFDSIPCSSPK